MKMSFERPQENSSDEEKVKISFHKPQEKKGPAKKAETSKDEVDVDVSEFDLPVGPDRDADEGLVLELEQEKEHDLELDLSGLDEKPKSRPEGSAAKGMTARQKETADAFADEQKNALGFRAVGEYVFRENKDLIPYFNDHPAPQARFKSGLKSLVNISALIYECDPKDLLKKSEFIEDLSVFIKNFKDQEKLP
jgi:hypothetical protein